MNYRRGSVLLLALFLMSPVDAHASHVKRGGNPAGSVLVETGLASWYGDRFRGKKTATGAIFDPNQLSAASRHLPLGTWVTVINEANGKSVEVRINDRGPFVHGRIIDLSKSAAERLQMTERGLARVRILAQASKQPTKKLQEAVGKGSLRHASRLAKRRVAGIFPVAAR
jgi:rare lipoprotein A